jgi:hypothetical protein
MKLRYALGLVLAASLLSLAGCGGGGGGGSSSSSSGSSSGSSGSTSSSSTSSSSSGGSTSSSSSGSSSGVSWTGVKQVGAAGEETLGYATASDASGNVYLAGTTGHSTYDAVTDLYHTTYVGFLTRFDANGNRGYTRQIGGADEGTSFHGATTDGNGNVYAVGTTGGSLGGNTLTGMMDLLLVKYDSGGNQLFVKQLGASGRFTAALAVAVDSSGGIFVVGDTNGNLDGSTSPVTRAMFLVKYDSAGNRIYTRQLGVSGVATVAHSVAVDASGSVYVAGYTQGDLDGNELTGSADAFIAKYDASGNAVFTRLLGAAGQYTNGKGIATDADGNVYLAGQTTGNLDGQTLTGASDIFVARYDGNGNRLYTRQFGAATKSTYANAIATDANGNVVVAGYTNASLDGATLAGNIDAFFVKYAANGDRLLVRQLGAAGGGCTAYGVATDAGGNAYLVGVTDRGLAGATMTGTADAFVAKYSPSGSLQ